MSDAPTSSAWIRAITGAQLPLAAAQPDPPAPVVTGAPFYHEDQVALGGLRRGLGNTCPSHALNAVLGGPATSYENQEAVTIDGFDTMVEALGLPPPGWRDYGAGLLPPVDLENQIGPRRAVVQVTRWDPATENTGAHFLALRGDGAELGWWAIGSMRQEQAGQHRQPIVGTTLTEALHHSLEQPGTQVTVGSWPPGTVLPAVGGAAQGAGHDAAPPAPLGSLPLNAFARWLTDSGLASLVPMAHQSAVPDYLIGQFLGSEAAVGIEEQALHRDVQQSNNAPVSDEEFAAIVQGGQVAALHDLHMRVTNELWRGQADAVLELLSQLPPLPPPPRLLASYAESEPPPEPETSRRSDIMAAVADALFEEDAGTVSLDGRSPRQQGHLVAALAYGSVTGLVLDLEEERFAPLTTQLPHLGGSVAAQTAGRLLLDRTNRRIAGTHLDRIPRDAQNILRVLGLPRANSAPDSSQAYPNGEGSRRQRGQERSSKGQGAMLIKHTNRESHVPVQAHCRTL